MQFHCSCCVSNDPDKNFTLNSKDRGGHNYLTKESLALPLFHQNYIKQFMEVDEKNTTRVKDKTPAPIQITAEQLFRKQLLVSNPLVPPKKHVNEPKNFMIVGIWESTGNNKGKGFEDNLRRNRGAIGVWIKYARFEESQHDFTRARSIYERALDVDPRCAPCGLGTRRWR